MAEKVTKIRTNILLWVLLFLAIFALSQLKLSVPLYDYVNFWSAGRLNLQGKNPYDLEELLNLQRQVGWKLEQPLQTWYPPWVLPLLMLFSIWDYELSRFLWFLASIGILVYAVFQSWKLYKGPPTKIWLGLIISFLFTPTLISLMLGQSAPWILLGVIGFLLAIRRQSLWAAGAWASLISIKPQLLYLFWFALLLWSIKEKKWQILAGSAVVITSGLIITLVFNPDVLQEYIQSIRGSPPNYLATPTFGYILRAIFGYEYFWLQFLPSILGVIWLLLYWRRKNSTWDWLEQMPILMFASMITSSYAWNHDQLILIPALIQVLVLLMFFRNRIKILSISLIFLIINFANLAIHRWLDESWVIWMAPVLLIIFLFVRQSKPISKTLAQEVT